MNRLSALIAPLPPLISAIKCFLITLVTSPRPRSLSAIRNLSLARWFRDPDERSFAAEAGTPIPGLIHAAAGAILELGPGTGLQMRRLDPDKVTRVYAVEPNPNFRPDLASRALETGLRGKYTVVTCGAEDTDVLLRHGIAPGTIDCVLSIQVLCCLSNPEKVVKELYRLLKPGGRFIFWEHGRSTDPFVATVQAWYTPVWRYFMGGCCLDRDISALLAGAGDWQHLGAIQSDPEQGDLLPRTWGTLTKAHTPSDNE